MNRIKKSGLLKAFEGQKDRARLLDHEDESLFDDGLSIPFKEKQEVIHPIEESGDDDRDIKVETKKKSTFFGRESKVRGLLSGKGGGSAEKSPSEVAGQTQRIGELAAKPTRVVKQPAPEQNQTDCAISPIQGEEKRETRKKRATVKEFSGSNHSSFAQMVLDDASLVQPLSDEENDRIHKVVKRKRGLRPSSTLPEELEGRNYTSNSDESHVTPGTSDPIPVYYDLVDDRPSKKGEPHRRRGDRRGKFSRASSDRNFSRSNKHPSNRNGEANRTPRGGSSKLERRRGLSKTASERYIGGRKSKEQETEMGGSCGQLSAESDKGGSEPHRGSPRHRDSRRHHERRTEKRRATVRESSTSDGAMRSPRKHRGHRDRTGNTERSEETTRKPSSRRLNREFSEKKTMFSNKPRPPETTVDSGELESAEVSNPSVDDGKDQGNEKTLIESHKTETDQPDPTKNEEEVVRVGLGPTHCPNALQLSEKISDSSGFGSFELSNASFVDAKIEQINISESMLGSGGLGSFEFSNPSFSDGRGCGSEKAIPEETREMEANPPDHANKEEKVSPPSSASRTNSLGARRILRNRTLQISDATEETVFSWKRNLPPRRNLASPRLRATRRRSLAPASPTKNRENETVKIKRTHEETTKSNTALISERVTSDKQDPDTFLDSELKRLGIEDGMLIMPVADAPGETHARTNHTQVFKNVLAEIPFMSLTGEKSVFDEGYNCVDAPNSPIERETDRVQAVDEYSRLSMELAESTFLFKEAEMQAKRLKDKNDAIQAKIDKLKALNPMLGEAPHSPTAGSPKKDP